MAQKKKAFPQKLWQLLNDCRLESAIRWSDDGHSFFVFEKELRNLCLGKENKIFYTRQPKSFIRQLHLYGFRKLNKNQFKHPNFCRDRPHLVYDIRRSYRQTNTVSPPGNELNSTTTRYMIAYVNPNHSNDDNSNDSTNNMSSSGYDGNTDYNYYITNSNMGEVAYENNQQFTSSSISSLCVCPGCCTL